MLLNACGATLIYALLEVHSSKVRETSRVRMQVTTVVAFASPLGATLFPDVPAYAGESCPQELYR